MPARSVGILLVQSSWGVWRYPENVGEVIVHVFFLSVSNEYKSIKNDLYG